MSRRALMLWLPLGLFIALASVFVLGLRGPGQQRSIASHLVGTAVPAFTLGPAVPGKPALAAADLADGRPTLVNVFASWCVPCASEAGQLDQLKAQGVRIVGIAIRDRPADLAAFLARNGDPFDRIGSDPASQVQIALGSSGVPESFVVDGRGVIRFQKIGPIMADDVPAIRAMVEAAR